MATKTIKNTDKIKIFSNEKSVSHQPRSGEIYWLWKENPAEQECYIEKTREEICRELRESKGFRLLFDEGVLVVKDEDIVTQFRLNCLDEYIKSTVELTQFIQECTATEFEDYCLYAPQTMIENIAVICTNKELNDRRKIKIYKEYTGIDLGEFYQDNEEDTPIGTTQEEKPKRQPRQKVKTKMISKEDN